MNEFYAMMSRMKYIDRWALMRNSIKENDSEHSLEVAMIAHALTVIGNKRLGKDIDPGKVALIAIYHDTTEIITGDMPTPIKYMNPEIREAFKAVETKAAERLMAMLPDDLVSEYRQYFFKQEEDAELWKLVKAADKLSALIKCIEEKKAGNTEFNSAYDALEKSILEMNSPEAEIFIQEFLPSYRLTLDELQRH